jgi:hypothetical protein
MLDREPDAVADRPGLLLITDKGFASKEFEADLALRGHSCCGRRSSGRSVERASPC